MTCAHLEIALCDYLDGTLAAAEKAEVERHLSECAACAEMARDAGAAMAFVERIAEVEPPPELVTRMFAIPGMREARVSVSGGIRGWRSEERRVGKECRSRWSPDHEKKKTEQATRRKERQTHEKTR